MIVVAIIAIAWAFIAVTVLAMCRNAALSDAALREMSPAPAGVFRFTATAESTDAASASPTVTPRAA